MNSRIFTIILVALIFVTLAKFSFYRVDENKIAIIKQFSKPIRSKSEVGLHFKIPFVQEIVFADNKIIEVEDIHHYTLEDSRKIEIRNNIQWRIINPIKYTEHIGGVRFGNQHAKAILLFDIISYLSSKPLESLVACEKLSIDEYCEIQQNLLNLKNTLLMAEEAVGMKIELNRSAIKLLK